jgi:O-antigen/teichoic acid export membrane protein
LRRQFLAHGLAYGGANLIAALGGMALIPIYTHALRPADYGVIDYVTALQSLLLIGAGLEVTQGIARFYASADTDEDRRAYASTGLWFLMASFAAVTALLYVGGRQVGDQFVGPGSSGSLWALVLTSMYARILFYALQAQARWELRSSLYVAATLVAVLATLGLAAYLVLARRAGLAGVFTSLSLGYGAACIVCVSALRGTYRLQFDWAKLRQMLRFSLPLTVSSFALFLAGYGDRFILQSALGFHELGVYGVGARLAAAITIAINGFQLGAAPLIYRNHAAPETPASLAQLMRLFLASALVGVLTLSSFSIELLRLFATPEYARAGRLIPVLALAVVLANLYIFMPGLTIHHRTKQFAFINVCVAAVSLTAVGAFVAVWGSFGAAAGVLFGSALAFVLHASASQRVYPIPVEWKRVTAGFGITVLTIAATAFLGTPGIAAFGARLFVFASASVALIAVLSTPSERALLQRAVASVRMLPAGRA